MVLIHQHKGLQGACEGFGVSGSDRTFAGHHEDVVCDLAPPVVLRLEHIRIRRRSAARFLDGREDVGFFQHPLVVVLAEAAEQAGGLGELISGEAAGTGADFWH